VPKLILIILMSLLMNFAIAKSNNDITHDTIVVFKPIRETYLITSANFNQFAQLETMVSPLVYKGMGASVSLGIQKRKNKTTTQFYCGIQQRKFV
jgi:hypothetical protein